MAFSEDLADLVASQLERFVTFNPHQLAAQVANLDFWLAEARHALDVLDGYEARFRRLELGQAEYVARHSVLLPSRVDHHASPAPPDAPRRTPDRSRRDARRRVADAAYQFLARCLREGLVTEERFRAACASLGVGIDPADVRRRG